ncbi:DUF349 domain-containing protein [Corynebacterium sp. 320]|uniref:DUF349 domain-containing protein n=1 Tax=Corynebacterium TaxID=1716 RepID=UPI00125CCADA|nr:MULTISPECIES: DUF349 domain-containing protein [Corynebacterium]KAB1503763.1 DUF349 domain-containing protein [Corynebacterium sp. 320]KAB1553137.1 DUF349 domain-containing protein [Corynebacterium sp. 321]KAB1553645.1 DUF349 domain-containing protein [Corynebacterium sp. 319]KAB3527899.1 DUF349 domain-containing protein [Corynebacterium sp. 250]KAB3540612.1 DUF349 domain-containing protein [Corynebacterium sp. 366]
MTTPQNPSPRPKPGPKPAPKPGPTAAGRRGPLPRVSPAVARQSDPSAFGRVDADGTAWVNTSAGERKVGVYKAGTPEEGLAHFGARFDDLSTEIALLEARLDTHPEEAARIRQDATHVKESLPTAAVIGDLDSLDQRLAAIIEQSFGTERQAEQNKVERREQAVAAKERLADEAEKLGAESTDWKRTGDRFHAMLEEWKSIRGVDRATDDALWERFSSGREAFNKRRGSHFSDLDKARAHSKRIKESLVERAEALSDSTDWADTARAYKDLMREWKAAGRAPRAADDALWEKFRAAQDKFFDARAAENSKRDEEFAANATRKQALLDEFDAKINPDNGLDKAKSALRDLQDKWEEIGFVPRNRVREFEDKIAQLERRVSEAEEAQWRKTDPEVQSRAAQFQAKVDQLNGEAAAAESRGDSARAAQLREQAAQWSQWAQAATDALEN